MIQGPRTPGSANFSRTTASAKRTSSYLAGSSRQIADELRRYLALGFETVIVRMPAPYDRQTIERMRGRRPARRLISRASRRIARASSPPARAGSHRQVAAVSWTSRPQTMAGHGVVGQTHISVSMKPAWPVLAAAASMFNHA